MPWESLCQVIYMIYIYIIDQFESIRTTLGVMRPTQTQCNNHTAQLFSPRCHRCSRSQSLATKQSSSSALVCEYIGVGGGGTRATGGEYTARTSLGYVGACHRHHVTAKVCCTRPGVRVLGGVD